MTFEENRGTAKPPVSVHFINAKPSSEIEKLQSRLLVRSHVGKWTWQQIKAGSVAGADSYNSDDRKGHAVQHRSSKETPDADDIGDPQPAPSTSWSSASSRPPASNIKPRNLQNQKTTSPKNQTHRTPERGIKTRSQIKNEQSQSPHGLMSFRPSIDYIGTGRFDPFQTYPSNLPPDFVNPCISVLWPSLTPHSANNPGNTVPAISGWLPLAMEDEMAFFALIFGSLAHKRNRYHRKNKIGLSFSLSPQAERIMELSEIETIKLINRALRDPSRAVSDAVILSVLCMAHNRAKDNDIGMVKDTVVSPFQPPLRSLQWLDIYGTLSPHAVHMNGLAQLVGMKGLENIELEGLAPIISYSDILTASKTLCRPRFPFVPLGDDHGQASCTLKGRFGLSFLDLDGTLSHLGDQNIGCTIELIELLGAMKMYTSILKDYVDGLLPEPDMCLTSDHRNCIQHRIMSLPSVHELDPALGHDNHPMASLAICVMSSPVHSRPKMKNMHHVVSSSRCKIREERLVHIIRVLDAKLTVSCLEVYQSCQRHKFMNGASFSFGTRSLTCRGTTCNLPNLPAKPFFDNVNASLVEMVTPGQILCTHNSLCRPMLFSRSRIHTRLLPKGATFWLKVAIFTDIHGKPVLKRYLRFMQHHLSSGRHPCIATTTIPAKNKARDIQPRL
ncbi:hypothetical protein VTN00DRAFT_3529 [Thermoascus crustaceus]|uniref:uncharacterized protein n=1 Tax=Thermoascus crustaceus TaxID=5088 RepID=UPI003742B8B0